LEVHLLSSLTTLLVLEHELLSSTTASSLLEEMLERATTAVVREWVLTLTTAGWIVWIVSLVVPYA
jgi:hypothetical protein